MFGQPGAATNAFETCRRYRRRLCHLAELTRYANTGRSGCKYFWAYYPEYHRIFGTGILTEEDKCLTSVEYTGLIPVLQHIYSSGYIYYCAVETGPYDDCEGTGKEYKGTLSETASGYKCQHWNKIYPHKHKLKLTTSDQNFCRNPDEHRKPVFYF
ncbi:threonyl-tRNA synthetase, variant 2 [Bonamia ostreae]|uniref:Threonyl-tRNA synthetase, variant 2 n=1 Tax=Bonamia ostreae TaxID=126728 RepID=A0ABV2AH99_9EUKA